MADIPTVRLGNSDVLVTRLISGTNPVVGNSHFSREKDREMREYFTPEQVTQYLRDNDYLFGVITSLGYFVPQEASSGKTLGKLITGTKAVNEDGSKLTFGKAVGRTLCRFIPFEVFSFLGGQDRPKGWHDRIPKTIVVSTRHPKNSVAPSAPT